MEPHQPVLREQVLAVLAPKEGERFADVTAGYGGHAAALIQAVGQSGFGYLTDRDPAAVAHLRQRFAAIRNLEINQADFVTAAGMMPDVDMILLDLGVSSPQLETAERGFSFAREGPLDMRMDSSGGITAAELVNQTSEAELVRILRDFGHEPQARRIAAAIVAARQQQPLATTTELAAIVERVSPRRGRKLHPATKTFQALRIAVNNELNQLETALPLLADKLMTGGRLAVISFHSLEDRRVKQFFRALCADELNPMGQVAKPGRFQSVTKGAVKGDEHDPNPRARSARLRAVVKKSI